MRSLKERFALGNEEGSTLIELGFCLPVVMMMTFGFIYFALLVFGMGSNAFSARAAVRYASLHSSTSTNPTTQAALNAIIARFAIPYPSNTTVVSYSYGAQGNTIGQTVTINVTATYNMTIFGTTYTSPQLSWGSSSIVIN